MERTFTQAECDLYVQQRVTRARRDAHNERAALIAEVESLQAEVTVLRGVLAAITGHLHDAAHDPSLGARLLRWAGAAPSPSPAPEGERS